MANEIIITHLEIIKLAPPVQEPKRLKTRDAGTQKVEEKTLKSGKSVQTDTEEKKEKTAGYKSTDVSTTTDFMASPVKQSNKIVATEPPQPVIIEEP